MITYFTLLKARDKNNAASLESIFSELRKNTPAESGCISYEIYSGSANSMASHD